MWRSEECWRPTLGWRGGQRVEDSGGEPVRWVEDLGRGFGASSLGCSANPRLAGWREVWGPLCWRGCLSLWSAPHPFCQTNLRNDGVLPWHWLKVRYTKSTDGEVWMNLISFQISNWNLQPKEGTEEKEMSSVLHSFKMCILSCWNALRLILLYTLK